jgi:hypothetical protein
MALSVGSLAGFPSKNTTFQGTAGTPTDAATFAFTNGVYTQSGTQYVAAIIDHAGPAVPRIFGANNGTGPNTAVEPLPTLISITQVSAHGASIQELPNRNSEVTDAIGYAGFVILLAPATGSPQEGTGQGTPVNIQVPGYTNATPTVSYPWPQLRFFVSMATLLVLASTQYG